MYTDKPPVELVSSEMVSHRGEARALDELYDDLFRAMGMYEGAEGTGSHGP